MVTPEEITKNGLPSDFFHFKKDSPEKWQSYYKEVGKIPELLREELKTHIREENFSFEQLELLTRKNWHERVEEILCDKITKAIVNEEQLIIIINLSKGKYQGETYDKIIGKNLLNTDLPHRSWVKAKKVPPNYHSATDKAVKSQMIKTAQSQEEIIEMFIDKEINLSPEYLWQVNLSKVSMQIIRDSSKPGDELFQAASKELELMEIERKRKENKQLISPT